MSVTQPISSDPEGPRIDWWLYPDRVGDGIYVSPASSLPLSRVFGGRFLAEALVSAGQDAPEGFVVTALSGQFLRVGNVDRPIRYEVEQLRNGRSVATRIVRAMQDDVLLALFMVSLAAARPSPDNQRAMPDVPGPDALADQAVHRDAIAVSNPALHRLLWWREHPLEVRPVTTADWSKGGDDMFAFWFRASPSLPGNDRLARSALVAYASDRFVLTTALLQQSSLPESGGVTLATIGHSLWLHRDYEPGSWLLSCVQSRSIADSRAFVRSEIFAANGDHVASMGQEGLIVPKS